MIKKWTLIFITINIASLNINHVLASSNFFDNKNQYRGFYWFEDEKLPIKKAKKDIKLEDISPQQAAHNIERRKSQLSEARNVMFELIFQKASNEEIYKAVQKYKQLEKEIMDNAVQLALAWEVVNFTHPNIPDRINNPVNVVANKLKRSHLEQTNTLKILKFAKDFDLVLFEQKDCVYCQEFRPILNYFTKKYGFNLEIIGSGIEYKQLIKKLSITEAPTLIAISKDGSNAFELIRGLSTLDELANNTMIAIELIESGYKFNQEDA